MKKRLSLLLSVLLVLGLTVSAQSKLEKYCFLRFVGRPGTDRFSVQFSYGTDSLFSFRDSSIIIDLKKVEQCKSMEEAFNYLGSLGWSLAIPPFAYYYSRFVDLQVFVFRRVFDRSDLR